MCRSCSAIHRRLLSNKSNLGFNQVFDFVHDFLKVFTFDDTELFDDLVLLDGEEFGRRLVLLKSD